MSPTRPSLHIALPTLFDAPFVPGEMPKTPDQQHQVELVAEPPPPPKQTFKIKRRPRVSAPSAQIGGSYEQVIPTIEMSEANDALPMMSSPLMHPVNPAHGLLAPVPSLTRAFTPPKTPAPRLNTAFEPEDVVGQEWDMIKSSRNKKPTFERASSIASMSSDSSLSSAGSSAFSAPYGDNLSPDSETTSDPFMEDDRLKEDVVTSPNAMQTSPCAKRVKTRRATKWTPEMDDHLWMTYMSYISDPTLTPFKMLPGTSPPLGVCCRVAVKAKRTWRDQRAVSVGAMDGVLCAPSRREGSPDTIRAQTEHREIKQPQWPRSEGASRRRLRYLCKRKPSFSAHYQRLLRTRSPSPFQSSSLGSTASAGTPVAPAFAGTDLKMSLITSTNPSMQPDGPLAQLSSDDNAARPESQRASRPVDWFARIPRSQAHQKSLSLQSGLGLQTRSLQPGNMLASPFDERSHLLESMANTKSLGRNNFNIAAPKLDSPFEVQGAPTAPRSLKRRFRSDEEKPKRTAVQDIFSSSSNPPPMLRNRGFTVGASAASHHLSRLFTPPSIITHPPPPLPLPTPTPIALPLTTPTGQDHEMADSHSPDLPEVSLLGPPGSRSAPRRLAEPVARLGSPFMETTASKKQHNTFPRSYLPTSADPQPFTSRLRELAREYKNEAP
nr:hypothetical protein B0A51_02164 [Rachicladosporium sp. CCFEE 5018]